MRLKYTHAPCCGTAPPQLRAHGVIKFSGIARAHSCSLLSSAEHRRFSIISSRRSVQQEILNATQPSEKNGAFSTASVSSMPSSGPSVQTVPGQLQSVASLRRVVHLLVVYSSGKVTEETRSITQLKEESRLHMRELLIVEQPSSLIQPRILARRHCICLVVGQVRAIIFTDRVYLFNSALLSGAKDFAASIASQLQQLHHTKASSSPITLGTSEGVHATSAGTGGGLQGYGDSSGASTTASLVDVGTRVEQEDITPFELLVMEQALLATTLKQAKRVAYAHKLVDRLLSKMSTVEKDDGNLYALFPLANTISHYELMTRGICECVRALLDDDRDMREACLTAKAKNSRDIAEEVEARSKAEAAAMGGLDVASTVSATGKLRAASEGSEAYTGTLRSPIASTRTLTMMLRRTSASPTGDRWARNNSPTGRGSASPRVSPIVDMEEPFGPRDRSSGLPPLLYQDQNNGSSTGVPAWPPEPGGARLEDGYPQMFARQEREPYSPEENRILRVSPDALSQLELMLESVYHRAAELNMEAVELGRTIRNKQDLLELQQSNYRNFILSVNLRMSVLSVSIASATFVTSAFGANLISGIEAVPGGLWGVTAVSGMAGWYIFRSLYRATISSSPTAAYARRLQTFSDFLFKLDTKVDAARSTLAVAASTGSAAAAAGAAAALHGRAPGSDHSRSVGAHPGVHSESTSASGSGDTLPSDSDQTDYNSGSDSNAPVDLPAGAIPSLNQRSVSSVMEQARTLRPLSRDEFKALHARTTGRMLSDDEVDLLFDIFDADSDGKLKIEEVVDVGTLSMGQPMNSRVSGQR